MRLGARANAAQAGKRSQRAQHRSCTLYMAIHGRFFAADNVLRRQLELASQGSDACQGGSGSGMSRPIPTIRYWIMSDKSGTSMSKAALATRAHRQGPRHLCRICVCIYI